jgi:hypothetical protein
MFGFLFQRKQRDVRQLMSRHMNRDFLRKFRYGQRQEPRGSFCRPVWVVPFEAADEKPRFDEAFAAITKDICPEGISLICRDPIEIERMLVGLGEPDDMVFTVCAFSHCTPMGLGFYQIGIHPLEVFDMRPADRDALAARAAALEPDATELCRR